jgi:hypothetical protein
MIYHDIQIAIWREHLHIAWAGAFSAFAISARGAFELAGFGQNSMAVRGGTGFHGFKGRTGGRIWKNNGTYGKL